MNSYGEKGDDMKPDAIGALSYLDYQALQWHEQLPEGLKLDSTSLRQDNWSVGTSYFQAVFFVRKSHLRNLIYRPVLQSPTRIKQNERLVLTAIDIAKDAIHTLSDLNRNTGIFHAQPVFFKHLLLTAFGNLLLAVVNATSRTWDRVRDEFDMALNLISFLSPRSTAIMHLWNRLKGLRDLQAKLSRESTAEINQAEAVACMPPSIEDLSFDELFPGFQGDPARSEPMDFAHDHLMDPIIRDRVNTLLDASVGAGGGLSDFPFLYWDGPPQD